MRTIVRRKWRGQKRELLWRAQKACKALLDADVKETAKAIEQSRLPNLIMTIPGFNAAAQHVMDSAYAEPIANLILQIP